MSVELGASISPGDSAPLGSISSERLPSAAHGVTADAAWFAAALSHGDPGAARLLCEKLNGLDPESRQELACTICDALSDADMRSLQMGNADERAAWSLLNSYSSASDHAEGEAPDWKVLSGATNLRNIADGSVQEKLRKTAEALAASTPTKQASATAKPLAGTSPLPVALPKPVAQMTAAERLSYTLECAKHYAPAEVQLKLQALTSPEAIAALAAYAAAHAYGVGEVLDVVALAALAIEGVDVSTKLVAGIYKATYGESGQDLNLAGSLIADAATSIVADVAGGLSVGKFVRGGAAALKAGGAAVAANSLGTEAEPKSPLSGLHEVASTDGSMQVQVGRDEAGNAWAVATDLSGEPQYALVARAWEMPVDMTKADATTQALLDANELSIGSRSPSDQADGAGSSSGGSFEERFQRLLHTGIERFKNPIGEKVRAEPPRVFVSTDSTKPNRMAGTTPEPRQMERWGTGVHWQQNSRDGRPTYNAMLVPNVVFEEGPRTHYNLGKRNVTGKLGSITPQPATGFFPINTGTPGKFQTQTDGHALVRTTLHPAGFYPGDANWPALHEALQKNPQQTPEWSAQSFGAFTQIKTENWNQTYLNIPNLLKPTRAASLNFRQISERTEVRASPYTAETVVAGKSSNDMLLTPYSWEQRHIKMGAANVVSANPSLYSTVGGQQEVGMYVALHGGVFDPQGTRAPDPVKDWHIVDGLVTSDPRIAGVEFAEVKAKSGIELRSESVVPDWQDTSAGVYARVPVTASDRTPASGTSTAAPATITAGGRTYVALTDMASLLNRTGRTVTGCKELAKIGADDLQNLNAGRIVNVFEPNSKKYVAAFEVGDWINTGARVVVGQAGLFLPEDVAHAKPR